MAATNYGVYDAEVVTIDMTGGITNANNEPFDLATNSSFDDPVGAMFLGATQPESYVYQWDHDEETLYVEGYGGTDPTGGTNTGKAYLLVFGRR